MSEIFGISAALLTPFNADGSIAFEMMARHARHVLDHGCSSITLYGTTGEGASLSAEERIEVTSYLRQAGIAANNMVLGIKADSIPQAIKELQAGIDLQCTSFLLAPPHYYKGIGDDGVFAWYEKVLEGFAGQELRIILYNIPQLTGVKIATKTAEHLYKKFPSLIYGVKDSSGDWDSAKSYLTLKNDLAILIGDERLLAEGIELGAQGSISGMANLFGQQLRQIALSGQQDETIVAMVDAIDSLPVIAAIKLLASTVFDNQQWLLMRPPLERMETGLEEKLVKDYNGIFHS